MGGSTTSIEIARSPEEVFEQMADARLQNDWLPPEVLPKKDIRMTTPEPIGPGSRFRGTYKGAGEVEYEILEYEPPRTLRQQTKNPMGTLHHDVHVRPANGGAVLEQAGYAEFKGVFKVLSPIMYTMFRRQFAGNARALKAYLESRPRR